MRDHVTCLPAPRGAWRRAVRTDWRRPRGTVERAARAMAAGSGGGDWVWGDSVHGDTGGVTGSGELGARRGSEHESNGGVTGAGGLGARNYWGCHRTRGTGQHRSWGDSEHRDNGGGTGGGGWGRYRGWRARSMGVTGLPAGLGS